MQQKFDNLAKISTYFGKDRILVLIDFLSNVVEDPYIKI
jgi:hypothetical protein